MGIWKCVYKHVPLDELNTTLEIVSSTQIYLTISVDSVWCVFLQITHWQALSQTSLRIPRRMSLMGGRKEKMFVPTLCLNFCTDRHVELGQMLKSSWTQKALLLWHMLAPGLKHLINPSITGLGNCVSPQTCSCSLPHPSLTPTSRHEQIDHLIQIHSLSSVDKVFQIPGVRLLAVLDWLGNSWTCANFLIYILCILGWRSVTGCGSREEKKGVAIKCPDSIEFFNFCFPKKI